MARFPRPRTGPLPVPTNERLIEICGPHIGAILDVLGSKEGAIDGVAVLGRTLPDGRRTVDVAIDWSGGTVTLYGWREPDGRTYIEWLGPWDSVGAMDFGDR